MAGPLQGIRVIDLTTMISGPLATMTLADQGAEVLKIEHPKGGDHSRQVTGRRGGMSASFLNNNRGKKSVTLNLKDPRGVEAALRLCETADVVIQNFRPGVVDRIGLGEAAVRAVRPDVIYASIAGFGFTGEWARRPVYDPLIQALSGLASVQGGADAARPRLVRTILPDKLTAIQTAQAITAALLARTRTGEGSHVQISMLDTVLAFLWSSDMAGYTFVGDELEPARDGDAQTFVELIYQTADGWMAVSAHTDSTWAGLSAAVGRPDWLEDPRFVTVAAREENKPVRLELTQEALLKDTTENWMRRLTDHDVPCAPVLTRAEVYTHPQVQANATVLEQEHPQAGRIRQARTPARFSATPIGDPAPARRLGEDTRTVLAEAGYDAEAIDDMIAHGIATDTQESAP
ncbi:CaiB/BaiF CoA transferase family protein [Jannaschia seohaensis]|uniref:Crotonobetainyl-CoA:carnitine CoA-transferase CaiB n=1 Tax=Jannaschia seohaensis TaxID=475081 RepID=A0A2Y9ABM3_9RHOB|nr:CoA transferase [Jannaschia seohaensis]PWJ21395.1 crotonobetainyl-CoA:carnitine CoA-transferase CaiB-like acyl-CoA transferase [Jannaschia seohaensis]SSA42001.1 Crotonobetainyl-CoA:carnitine CoA-transferase CaiB [Jannaschia seohaensis]